jgi:hypothetical protein
MSKKQFKNQSIFSLSGSFLKFKKFIKLMKGELFLPSQNLYASFQKTTKHIPPFQVNEIA